MDARLVEVQTALLAAKLNRSHTALQESLSLATFLMDLVKPCQEVGLNLEVAIHFEAANALWDQGEMAPSIGMLKALDNTAWLKRQNTNIAVGRPELLSKIGSQVSVARLEKPDRILENYLKPALKELKGKTKGDEAGTVFHQFAVFCDQQLQDADGLEDLEHLKKLSKNKRDDVEYLAKMVTTASSSIKDKYKRELVKHKTMLRLDEEELQRHISSREEFLRQCLENHLLSLGASDDHDTSALRFTALWLEHSEEHIANDAVGIHLKQVPSRKFASLMNQLTSRLQDNDSTFQNLLFELVVRICKDHPYHGMYQIYAGARNAGVAKDDTAVSRNAAAIKVSKQFLDRKSSVTWNNLHITSKAYGQLAAERGDGYKQGRKISFKDSIAATRLNESLRKHPIPPPTMQIKLAADCDYSKAPTMLKFEPNITVASGVSAPKIITAIANDGAKYKQLV
jgi:ataxia telangiectasia mutated family protein